MNVSAASTAARAAGVLLIVALAVAAGLATGNLIDRVSGDRSITANAGFSVDAMADLQALRADEPESIPQEYVDYAQRHAKATPPYIDYGLRHATARAPQLTDTFRLTGPSDLEADVVLRRQAN